MKRLLVAVAAVFVSGMVWAAPVDLTTQQVICGSAVPDLLAGLLTNEGGNGFIYAEDSNKDGTFNENENYLFEGTLTSTAKSDLLNKAIAGFSGATAFATVQEISKDLGNAVVTFHYGFEVASYQGVEFGLLSIAPKDGSKESILPLECRAYVPQN